MARVLKVFGSAEERKQLAAKHKLLADYDAFTLLEVADQHAKRVARSHLVEDITQQYRLPIGDTVADTRQPRITARGVARPHRAYEGVKSPGPGRHHYIVQFVGPIKKAWLTRVRKAGGEPRVPYEGFAYVVRMDKKALAAVAALPVVRWVGHLPASARVAAGTRRRIEGGRRSTRDRGNGPSHADPAWHLHSAVFRTGRSV